MNILVTGANGYIGSYLCRRIAQDNQVIGLTRRANGPNHSLLSALPNFRWHRTDLAKSVSMPDDIDMIIHTAGGNPGSTVTTADYVSSNVIATKNLLDFAIEKGSPLFIFLSSTSVYGRIDSSVVDEETPINANTPYGITKYIAELLLREREAIIPSITLRIPIVVGASIESGWPFKAYQILLRKEPLYINNADFPLNMLDVSDVYDLVFLSQRLSPRTSEVFTVGCKDFFSVRQVAKIIRQRIQSESRIIENHNTQMPFTVSSEKAARLLDFRPKSATDILDGFLNGMAEATSAHLNQ